MNRFICTTCGRFCYSAASINDMVDDRCPTAGCGGVVAPAPENDANSEEKPEEEDHGT